MAPEKGKMVSRSAIGEMFYGKFLYKFNWHIMDFYFLLLLSSVLNGKNIWFLA